MLRLFLQENFLEIVDNGVHRKKGGGNWTLPLELKKGLGKKSVFYKRKNVNRRE